MSYEVVWQDIAGISRSSSDYLPGAASAHSSGVCMVPEPYICFAMVSGPQTEHRDALQAKTESKVRHEYLASEGRWLVGVQEHAAEGQRPARYQLGQ